MKSETFCILPWIHFYSNPDGSVLPCCIGDHENPLGNVQDNSIDKIWNSEKYKSLRLKMLEGKRANECKSCYQQEDAGVRSFRQSMNKEYAEFLDLSNETNSDGSLSSMKLKYLDIRWSNICNFKCRSCSSTYSSSWASENNKQGFSNKIFMFAGGNNNDLLYNQIEPYLSEVKEIYFAGGEPLLMDKHYDILQYLIQTGNTDIKIRYNSNLSSLIFKNISIIDLWNQFSNIHLNVSLDSWGERAEYIREGTEWCKVEENFKQVKKQCSHITIGISSVISVFNVYSIIDFIDYMIEKELLDNNTLTSFYCLINPDYYSFNVFDDNMKKLIINKLYLKKYKGNIKVQIENIIKLLNSSKFNLDLQKQFKYHTDYYDSIRQRNFVKTFPELKNFYESI